MVKDYYAVLGLTRDASDEDIKAAYRRLTLECHPDRHENSPPEVQRVMEERFKDVSTAYTILSDQDRRKRFDLGQLDPDEVAKIIAAFADDLKATREAVRTRNWFQVARNGLRMCLNGLDGVAKQFGDRK